MTKPVFDPDAVVKERQELASTPADEAVVPVNPCRVPRECTVPVTPRNYSRAVAAGCEDAYLNAMRAKYGEGWD